MVFVRNSPPGVRMKMTGLSTHSILETLVHISRVPEALPNLSHATSPDIALEDLPISPRAGTQDLQNAAAGNSAPRRHWQHIPRHLQGCTPNFQRRDLSRRGRRTSRHLQRTSSQTVLTTASGVLRRMASRQKSVRSLSKLN